MNVHVEKEKGVIVLSFRNGIEAMDVVAALAAQIAPMMRTIKQKQDARYVFSPLVLALRMTEDSTVTDFELQAFARKILMQGLGNVGLDGRGDGDVSEGKKS